MLNENRNGLILGITVTEANSTAERSATLELLDEYQTRHQKQPKTLGADKGYGDGSFFLDVESREIDLHVPLIKEPRRVADAPEKDRAKVEARHRMKARELTEGCRLSQKCRTKIEECYEQSKLEAGLDEYEVCSWLGWHRHITLSMQAFASSAVIRHHMTPPQKRAR